MNYAITLVDPHFGDTLITVLSNRTEARRLAWVHDATASECSDFYTVTETEAPAQHTTARAYFCSIPDWNTREAMLNELSALCSIEVGAETNASYIADRIHEEASIEAAELVGPNSCEYDHLCEQIEVRMWDERLKAQP